MPSIPVSIGGVFQGHFRGLVYPQYISSILTVSLKYIILYFYLHVRILFFMFVLMKEKKDIKIRYRSGVGVERGKDGFTHKEYEYDFISAATSCTKRFRRAIYILMGIDGCERNLIEWLSEVMTEGNYVSNNELTRRNFIEFYKKHKKKDKKPYTETTVKIAFQRLASSDLLIKQTRGTFMVNPLYYFEGDDESRIRAIKMMMEFKQGTNTTISMEVNKK